MIAGRDNLFQPKLSLLVRALAHRARGGAAAERLAMAEGTGEQPPGTGEMRASLST